MLYVVNYSSTSYTVDMSNGKCTCYMLLSTIPVRVIQRVDMSNGKCTCYMLSTIPVRVIQ